MKSGQPAGRGAVACGVVMGLALAGAVTLWAVRTAAAPVASTAAYAPGEPDPNFGAGGIVNTSFVAGQSGFSASLAVQSDGKIVVVGNTRVSSSNINWAATRFHADGTRDTSFGSGGTVTIAWTNKDDWAQDVAIQADGKIVICGAVNSGNTWDFGVARYNSNGTLDSSFGSGGRVTTDVGKKTSDIPEEGLELQPDGKIIVVGKSGGNLALVRYNSNGTLDTTFNGNGKVITTPASVGVANFNPHGPCTALQADGRILISTSVNEDSRAVLRYNANGSRDTTYGGGGIAFLDIGVDGGGITLQHDGKSVVVGDDGLGAILVVRLTQAGAVDSSFGNSGIFQLGAANFDWCRRVVVQNDGRIVVVGTSITPGDRGIAAFRLWSDGSLDTTFGTQGVADSGQIAGLSQGWNVALQPDGGIIGLGTEKLALCRFLPDDSVLASAPDPVAENGTLTLAVAPIHGLNGAIQYVEFFIDFDDDGALDDAIDMDLGAGANVGGIWGLNVPVTWPADVYTYFAIVGYAGGHTVVATQGEVTP